MRYYEVYIPGEDEPLLTTNARALCGLPEGTRVLATITDRDGSLIDQMELPVIDGRVKFPKRREVPGGLSIHKSHFLRFFPGRGRG